MVVEIVEEEDEATFVTPSAAPAPAPAPAPAVTTTVVVEEVEPTVVAIEEEEATAAVEEPLLVPAVIHSPAPSGPSSLRPSLRVVTFPPTGQRKLLVEPVVVTNRRAENGTHCQPKKSKLSRFSHRFQPRQLFPNGATAPTSSATPVRTTTATSRQRQTLLPAETPRRPAVATVASSVPFAETTTVVDAPAPTTATRQRFPASTLRTHSPGVFTFQA